MTQQTQATQQPKSPPTPAAGSAPAPEAKLTFWQRLVKAFKQNSIPTAIMAVLWMLLWWCKYAGIQWAILWPFQFLTGALNGLTGNVWGGAVGRTILLILFNSFFRGILANSGDRKKRAKAFKDQTVTQVKDKAKSEITGKIPYYSNLKTAFSLRTPQAWGFSALGLSVAMFAYPFITGDGALINSMVCLALFVNLIKQLASNRGLLISLTNYFLSKKGLKKIDKGQVNRVIAGYALGSALSVGVAALQTASETGFRIWTFCARTLPWILLGLAVLGIFWRFLGPVLIALLKGLGKLLKLIGSLIGKLFKKISSGKGAKKS